MHAEAVRIAGCAQNIRTDHLLTCEECGVQYTLYCDKDAAVSFTHWSLLAQEIITARHPDHTQRVVLDWIETF